MDPSANGLKKRIPTNIVSECVLAIIALLLPLLAVLFHQDDLNRLLTLRLNLPGRIGIVDFFGCRFSDGCIS